MKLPISELNKYVPVKHTAKELAEIFVSLGFEDESIEGEVLDLEITPNRGDCLSVLGLAREYAAKTAQPLKPLILTSGKQYKKNCREIEINIADKDACRRYTGAIIKNIQIKPSSPELKDRIKKFGMDSINNIVDITNIVMMELGTPMHAFDLTGIKGNKMLIRTANENEQIKTLDKKINTLSQGAIVIEDGEGLMDLAGIMGGERPSIKTSTVDILLQAAFFDRKIIRQTAKFLGKTTEASYRYERGIDAEQTTEAIEMAIEMISQEVAGAQVSERFDINYLPHNENKIKFDSANIKKLLGVDIDNHFIQDVFARLGIQKRTGKYIVPSWRHDLFIEEDLIEEVARMYDLSKIKPINFEKTNIKCNGIDKSYYQQLAIKNQFVKAGYTEISTHTFISDRDFESLNLNEKKMLTPVKAVSKELNFLRPNLLVGMAKIFSQNRWCYKDGMKLFEIGSIFYPNEQSHIAIASFSRKDLAGFTKDQNQIIMVGDSHNLYQQYNLKKTFYFLEMDIAEFPPTNDKMRLRLPKQFHPVSDFPPITRDIAIIVDQQITAGQILGEIRATDKIIMLVEKFDEYISNKFGAEKKSLAFHIVLDDEKKTLASKDTDAIMKKIVNNLDQKYKAKLRE